MSSCFVAGSNLCRKPGRICSARCGTGAVDDLVIVGQVGQSLDGRVATATGHSKYINCPAGIEHLHRLRALVDIVVVGIGTALADDPQLTVRQVAGPQPARAVIDPRGRLGADARLFAEDGVRRLSDHDEGTRATTASPASRSSPCLRRTETLRRPPSLAALKRAGMRRMLIEGGADTLSRFIAARCLDRLHVTVAPVMLGAGGQASTCRRSSGPIRLTRMPIRVHQIEDDVLFDCDLSAQRVALGVAKKST